MRLSIVIPVYNVERYIDRCLASCVQQNLPTSDYEIIVVNDGTPDKSMDVVRAYAQSHSNIVVIEQENKGLSEARNTGLRIAQGDYVWFVDSDDWIETDCLKSLTDQMFEYELDALQIPIITVCDEGKNYPYDYSGLANAVYSGKELHVRSQYKYPAQFTLYKRTFLHNNNLDFCSGLYHEDMDFSPRAYFFAQRIGFYSSPVYYYEQGNSSSIMHNRSNKHVKDMLLIIRRHLAFVTEQSCEPAILSSFGTTIGQLLNNSLEIINGSGTNDQASDFLNELSKFPQISKLMSRSTNRYFRFEAFLFRISPYLLWQFYHIVHLPKKKK